MLPPTSSLPSFTSYSLRQTSGFAVSSSDFLVLVISSPETQRGLFFLPDICVMLCSCELSATHNTKCFSDETVSWVRTVLWVSVLASFLVVSRPSVSLLDSVFTSWNFSCSLTPTKTNILLHPSLFLPPVSLMLFFFFKLWEPEVCKTSYNISPYLPTTYFFWCGFVPIGLPWGLRW